MNKNKKKIILTLVILIVSISSIIGVKNIEKRLAYENNKTNSITKKDYKDKKDQNIKKNSFKLEKQKNEKEEKNIKPQNRKEGYIKEDKNDIVKNNNLDQKNKQVEKDNQKDRQFSKPNIKIIDEVKQKVVCNTYVDFKDKPTVAEVTIKALNGNYCANGSGSSIYFSSIAGINEKSEGPLSGWCYYINGNKAKVAAGECILNLSDTLEWKFLKDGMHE